MAKKKTTSKPNPFDSFIYAKKSNTETRKLILSTQQKMTVYFVFSILLIVGLTTGLVLALLPAGRTYYTYGDDINKDYDNRRFTTNYDYMTGETTTDTIFVSSNGDNSTGGNWDTAYNDIWYALTQASTHINNMTLIQLSIGEHDVNQTGTPTVNANVIIRGSSTPDITNIINNHTSADAIFKFTKFSYLHNLEFYTDSTPVSYGIIHEGSDFFMDTCSIVGVQSTSAIELVRVVDSTSLHLNGVAFHGDYRKNHTTSLYTINCTSGFITNNRFVLGNIGFRAVGCISFRLIGNSFRAQNTSMLIDSTSPNWNVENTYFTSNLYEINSTSYILFHEHSTYLDVTTMILTPDDTTGIEATGHANADTWGDWVNMTYTPTKWFKIAGGVFVNPDDASAYYRISMRTWNSLENEHNVLDDFIIESGRTGSFPINIGSGILPQGSIISYRIMTSDGGADTIDAFARIVEF